jgi:hypothetical protein
MEKVGTFLRIHYYSGGKIGIIPEWSVMVFRPSMDLFLGRPIANLCFACVCAIAPFRSLGQNAM